MLAVYRGTALGALTLVACSDDIDAQAGNLRSRLRFGAVAGQTYYLQAGGYYDGTTALGGLLALGMSAVAAARRHQRRAARRLAERPARRDVHVRRRRRDELRVPARRGGVRRLHLAATHPRPGRRRSTPSTVRALWAGPTDTAPETRTWTVDTVAPDTTITDWPRRGR